MIGHIQQTRDDLMLLLNNRRTAWKDLSRDELQGIVHDSLKVRGSMAFTERTAAEINRAAASFILEERASR